MTDRLFAEVIIPVAAPGTYTYLVPEKYRDRVSRGSRVVVQFGKKRYYSGIVAVLHSTEPGIEKIREISDVTDPGSLIDENQLRLWKWIAGYYMCSLGEVMNAAMPAGLKGSRAQSPKAQGDTFLSLDPALGENDLNILLDRIARAPARLKLMTAYLDMSSWDGKGNPGEIRKAELLSRAGVTAGPLRALVKEGVFKVKKAEYVDASGIEPAMTNPATLSVSQGEAYEKIRESFKSRDVVLLKGVTSSGKTELYIHLIQETLNDGKQALFLLPEIALTSQMINRLKKHFGGKVGVYHSRFTDKERIDIWKKTSGAEEDAGYQIILGVRSSIFLPFTGLGLVIVDEEHENSYKQQDPAPRYNARDSAIILAGIHGAKTLLGSATPSVETMHNALDGKYGFAELNQRYGEVLMPEMILADTRDAYRRKMMVSHFTPQLLRVIKDAFEKKEQVVLFRNRRGYAPVIQCGECGWIPGCKSCSVTMTYHKGLNRMKCHYCGYSTAVPSKCSVCGSPDIVMKGFGTEKIEDELKILFPDIREERMDLDTTRRKGAFDKIIDNLEKGKTDILIGTQMISKGLDFENLTVVGILNIDNMLNFPDFRSHEKCYQMIAQVSGRAGRRSRQGKVVVQTFDPSHAVMIQAMNHNYDSMYKTQLEERREFNYPPFTRLIRLYIRNRDRKAVIECAGRLASDLRNSFGARVLGPEFPPLSRLQSYYVMSVIVKIEKDKSPARAKRIIAEAIARIINSGAWPGTRIHADVDPL